MSEYPRVSFYGQRPSELMTSCELWYAVSEEFREQYVYPPEDRTSSPATLHSARSYYCISSLMSESRSTARDEIFNASVDRYFGLNTQTAATEEKLLTLLNDAGFMEKCEDDFQSKKDSGVESTMGNLSLSG